MDTEFHYYVTHRMLTAAGVPKKQAGVIAYASQYVDDNTTVETIQSMGQNYHNPISQTIDILKPEDTYRRIYCAFHFIPGDARAGADARKDDDTVNPLVCTPDSACARAILDGALASDDPYRIGIALHSYIDTWAHQNFTGDRDIVNDIDPDGPFNIGHAEAAHDPDVPNRVWKDPRLKVAQVDNARRFIDAAGTTFDRLCSKYNGADAPSRQAFEDDLADVLGSSHTPEGRIRVYMDHWRIPAYDAGQWMREAVEERHTDAGLEKWWRSTAYKRSHWYKFQEAVRVQFQESLGLIRTHLGPDNATLLPVV